MSFDPNKFSEERAFNAQEQNSFGEVLQLVKRVDGTKISRAFVNNGIRNGALTPNDRDGSLWIWTEANIYEFPHFPNISEWDAVPNKYYRLRVLEDENSLRAIANVSVGLICDFRAVGDSREALREIIADIVKKMS